MSRIDEAKQRWGSAEVLQGEGQGSPNIDLSPWRKDVVLRTEEPKTGIADKHFDVFANVARQRNCVILVRKGKFACVSWIKKDYPAKPSSVWKIKNSKETGLVTCTHGHPKYSYAEQVEHAWQAGYYVLEESADNGQPPTFGSGKGFFKTPGVLDLARGANACFFRAPGPLQHLAFPSRLLQARRGNTVMALRFPGDRFAIGQVIDPRSLFPLTGDYDLMGVFPMDGPGSKALVMVHNAADQPQDLEQAAPSVLLRKMRDNPYCREIGDLLNARFGGRPRIMHGAHDLKYDPDENNQDGASAFSPESAFYLPSADEVVRFYKQIGRLAFLPRPERDLPGG